MPKDSACRRAASRLCALPPPHFPNWPIPAGLVPAQVTRRVSGLSPPGGRGGGRPPLFISTGHCRWWVGGGGRRRRPSPNSAELHKGPLCPTGGKCGRPQRRRVAGKEGGATLRQELGRWAQRRGVLQCPRCREVAGLARSHDQERKDLPLATVAGGRHCPLSLAAGSSTPARQLLGECSKEP